MQTGCSISFHRQVPHKSESHSKVPGSGGRAEGLGFTVQGFGIPFSPVSCEGEALQDAHEDYTCLVGGLGLRAGEYWAWYLRACSMMAGLIYKFAFLEPLYIESDRILTKPLINKITMPSPTEPSREGVG